MTPSAHLTPADLAYVNDLTKQVASGAGGE